MIINLMMIVIQIGADEGGGSTKFLSLFYSTAGPCLTCQRCGDEYDDHHGHREYADHYDHCGHRDCDLASMHWCNDGFTVLGLSSWMSSLAEKRQCWFTMMLIMMTKIDPNIHYNMYWAGKKLSRKRERKNIWYFCTRPGECSDSEVTLHQFARNLIVLDQDQEREKVCISVNINKL